RAAGHEELNLIAHGLKVFAAEDRPASLHPEVAELVVVGVEFARFGADVDGRVEAHDRQLRAVEFSGREAGMASDAEADRAVALRFLCGMVEGAALNGDAVELEA